MRTELDGHLELTNRLVQPSLVSVGVAEAAVTDCQRRIELDGMLQRIDGLLVTDQHDLVDQAAVEDARNESGADTLNEVWRMPSARQHGAHFRLCGDHTQSWVSLFQDVGHTGQRAARPDTQHQCVDHAIGVTPDFFSRGATVNFRVRGMSELPGHRHPRCGRDDLFGLGDGTANTLGARRKNQLCTKETHQPAAFHGEAVGHSQDAAVTLDRAGEGQTDTGISRSGLDDDTACPDRTGRFHGVPQWRRRCGPSRCPAD